MPMPSPLSTFRAWVLLSSLLSTIVTTQVSCFTISKHVVHTRSSSSNNVVATSHHHYRPTTSAAVLLRAAAEANDDDEDEDPLASWKEAYPDLEFVDYSDPNYQVDMGLDAEEGFSGSALSGGESEAVLSQMREERRRRNDEYQFETYYRDVLRNGEDEYWGEWTVYKAEHPSVSSDSSIPRLSIISKPLRVKAKGRKVVFDPDTAWRVDGEYLLHEETAEEDGGDGDDQKELLASTYWPEKLTSYDFRGPAGIMTVGNAYTICETVPPPPPKESNNKRDNDDTAHDGPFDALRTEVGLFSEDMRFRVKLDYRVDNSATTTTIPSAAPLPLLLYTMTVCRERLSRWPRDPTRRVSSDLPLFGPAGAPGGLYDPPPVGAAEAPLYLTVDLDGTATVLLPYRIPQSTCTTSTSTALNNDDDDGAEKGWVTSLDWTPGNIRYQVDRKVHAGPKVKGLRTLEVSEVQANTADQYRPKDGGANMSQ